MRLFLYLFICFQLSLTIYSSKRFRLGRTQWGGLGAPAGSEDIPTPPEEWFDQKLDHYSPTDQRTWRQRFFVNHKFYDMKKKDGPIFLMIGGEGPADARWMVKGAWIEYAEKMKALCIMLEHRYYGKSHPVPNMSVKNLQYLNSRQALADLANFIGQMNDKYNLDKSVKWIVFGGSYPGSLAAWMRLKYPHLVFAAVSSSGPLLAKTNFEEYFEVVIESLRAKTGSDDCGYGVREAHSAVVAFVANMPEVIDRAFKLCTPIKNASALDVTTFYSNIADAFAEVVQYNEDNRLSVEERFKNVTINTICDMLDDHKHPYYMNLGNVTNLMLERNKQKCLDYSYDNMIKEMRAVEWSNDAGRQWFYQTCTEFGFYQTSTGEPNAFGGECDLNYYLRQCRDIFGPKFNASFINAAVRDTNNYYGGKDIAASRVLYVQGSVDPWHALGLTATRDAISPVIYIEGTAHCANMYPSTEKDLPALKQARVAIYNQLLQWISQE